MSSPADPEIKTFALGDFALVSGAVLPGAFIAYKTFGSPSLPAIIYPTWYSGLIADNEWLVGRDRALSPDRYYIIIPALFGNGQSTSPSNTTGAASSSSTRPFPDVTFRDNVTAQHRLVTEGLGVAHARAVLGWSMGAGQTYQWLTQFPDFMDLAVPFCGSARTSLHNQVFLEGPKSALLAAKGAASGGVCRGETTAAAGTSSADAGAGGYRGWTAEERDKGLRALGRVYAGWGFSQAFYRERVYETLGYENLEDFMVRFWEAWAGSKGKHLKPNFPAPRRPALPPAISIGMKMAVDAPRSREHAGHAAHLAGRGLLRPGALQRRLRARHAEHQGQDARPARQDGSLLPSRGLRVRGQVHEGGSR